MCTTCIYLKADTYKSCLIFVLNTGYFPSEWCCEFIVPIPKSGDLNDTANYRGSSLGKLFTRILDNRLDEWVERYFVYIEVQAGFRSMMGTINNVLYYIML